MCYEQLLGLKNCGATEPTTGLYIDTLGITTSLLGQLITDQYNNGTELFDDKRSFAWRKLSSDILTRLNDALKADTVVENARIGIETNATNNTADALGAGKYAGIRLKIDPNDKSFVELYLSYLSIAVATPAEVLVFDMTTGKKIGTIADVSVEKFIGTAYKAKRRKLDLAFVYESLEDTIITVPKIGGCFDCGGNLKMMNISPYVAATGIELTTDGTTVLTSAAKKYTQGMSLNYNVNCDRESWLCSIGGLMALPLAYATAVEIYDYALMTSPNQRVNTAVSVNSESIKEARDICATKYNDELRAMLQNMRVPNDPNCFSCRQNQRYVTMLP